MVLHALGMCPICTYRTGRNVRNIPSTLYRLHDTVSAYATATLRLRGMSRSSTSTSASRSSPPSSMNPSTLLPVPFAPGSDLQSSLALSTEPDPLAPLRTDKDNARARLLATLLTFSAEFPRVDLQEVSPALFSVLLELTQTLEMEGLLVLGWIDKKRKKKKGAAVEEEGGDGAGSGADASVVDAAAAGDGSGAVACGDGLAVGEQEDVSGEGEDEVPEFEFKKYMAQRIEAIKMAMIAPKGWYLEETVKKFEGQGRRIVNMMLEAAARCVEEGERVVLGAENRDLWLEGVAVQWKYGKGVDGPETGEDKEND